MNAAVPPQAAMAGLAALSLSILLHLGGGLRFALPTPQVKVSGGAPVAISRLGNSFRDVAQGSPHAAPPQTVPALRPQPTPPLKAAPQISTQPHQARPDLNPAVDPIKAITATPVLTRPREPETAKSAPPQHSVTPTRAATRLTAQPETQPEPRPAPKPVVKPPSDQGSARAERQGSADGQRSATAPASAAKPAAQSPAAGNSDLTNYAGKVWRKIQRARPNSTHSGTTVIALSISARGRLTSVNIARSSGSPQLDQLALRAARKAAPFPAPPDHTAHRFTFKVRGQ